MRIEGLHHVTLICADMERTVQFYTKVLGLRLVKKTYNFDNPSSKHYYFGDWLGAPGTVITFFEEPQTRKGNRGVGVAHHVAFAVENEQALLAWKAHLEAHGIRVQGPYDRRYFKSIYFRDPDDVIIELATRGPGFTADEPEEALGSAVKDPPGGSTAS